MNFPRKFKYVIIDGLFPRLCTVAEEHNAIGKDNKITSAGFAELSWQENELLISCYGESIGLKIRSNPEEDAETIKRMFSSPSYI